MATYEITFKNDEIDFNLLKEQFDYEHIREINPKKEGVFFKVKNRLEKINPNEIKWIQANDIYSIIRTNNARYLVSHTLKSLEEKLSDTDFLRVHRSYIVQLKQIRAIEDGQVLIGEDYIPIGQTHKETLFNRLDFM